MAADSQQTTEQIWLELMCRMIPGVQQAGLALEPDKLPRVSGSECGRGISECDIQLVAEGVETEAQLSAIKLLGCDLIQGYFYSKPLDSKTFFSEAQRLK